MKFNTLQRAGQRPSPTKHSQARSAEAGQLPVPTSASTPPAARTETCRPSTGPCVGRRLTIEFSGLLPAPSSRVSCAHHMGRSWMQQWHRWGKGAVFTHQPAHPVTGFSGFRAEPVSPQKHREEEAASVSDGLVRDLKGEGPAPGLAM